MGRPSSRKTFTKRLTARRGGDDPTWAAPGDTYVDFARFAVAERYIGP